MGLFGKAQPGTPPRVVRDDLASAIRNAPSRELERLSWAQSELNYLDENVAPEEHILGVASCDDAIAAGMHMGVIALASRRLLVVLGHRDKGGPRGRSLGEPSVYTMDFNQLSAFTFGSHNVRGVRGRLATFRFNGSGELILNVGQDDNWADNFLNLTKHQMNKSKLA